MAEILSARPTFIFAREDRIGPSCLRFTWLLTPQECNAAFKILVKLNSLLALFRENP